MALCREGRCHGKKQGNEKAHIPISCHERIQSSGRLSTTREQRDRAQQLQLGVEISVQLIHEEPVRRIMGERRLALGDRRVDHLEVVLDDGDRLGVELRAALLEDLA